LLALDWLPKPLIPVWLDALLAQPKVELSPRRSFCFVIRPLLKVVLPFEKVELMVGLRKETLLTLLFADPKKELPPWPPLAPLAPKVL